MERLKLIRNQLASGRVGVLDSYRKLSTFNKETLFDLYNPAFHEIRQLVINVFSFIIRINIMNIFIYLYYNKKFCYWNYYIL